MRHSRSPRRPLVPTVVALIALALCAGPWGCASKPGRSIAPLTALSLALSDSSGHAPFEHVSVEVLDAPVADSSVVGTLSSGSGDSVFAVRLIRTGERSLSLLVPDVPARPDYELRFSLGGRTGEVRLAVTAPASAAQALVAANAGFDSLSVDGQRLSERLRGSPAIPAVADSAGVAVDVAALAAVIADVRQPVAALSAAQQWALSRWLESSRQAPPPGARADAASKSIGGVSRTALAATPRPGACAAYRDALARDLIAVILAIAAFTLAFSMVPVSLFLIGVASLGVFMAVATFNVDAIGGFATCLVPDGELDVTALPAPAWSRSRLSGSASALLVCYPGTPVPVDVRADFRTPCATDLGGAPVLDATQATLTRFAQANASVNGLLAERFRSRARLLDLSSIPRPSPVRLPVPLEGLRVSNVTPTGLSVRVVGATGNLSLVVDGAPQTEDQPFAFDLSYADPGVRTVTTRVSGSLVWRPRIARIVVTPDPAELEAGQTLRLQAEARDSLDHVIPGIRFAWLVEDRRIARVDTSGTLRADAEGTTTVRASAGGVTGSAAVRVAPPTFIEGWFYGAWCDPSTEIQTTFAGTSSDTTFTCYGFIQLDHLAFGDNGTITVRLTDVQGAPGYRYGLIYMSPSPPMLLRITGTPPGYENNLGSTGSGWKFVWVEVGTEWQFTIERPRPGAGGAPSGVGAVREIEPAGRRRER